MNYKMIRLKNESVKMFKHLAQEAFQTGFEDEFGKYERRYCRKGY